MIARDYFYADAYRRKEVERTKWEKEVLEEYINSQNNIPCIA